jgi:hypothetical protein
MIPPCFVQPASTQTVTGSVRQCIRPANRPAPAIVAPRLAGARLVTQFRSIVPMAALRIARTLTGSGQTNGRIRTASASLCLGENPGEGVYHVWL